MYRPERFINNLDFQFLKETVVLDLAHIYGKGVYPNQRDINEFIAEDLAINASMICGIQNHPRFPKVFIKLEKPEQVTAVVAKLQGGLMMTGKNIKVYGFRCDRPMVNIVLNGQDMCLEKEEIVRVLSSYGTVEHCERGRNNDLSEPNKFVHDGTWIVRLTPKITTKPPETIYYFGQSGIVQTWILNFEGMGSSCVLCGRQGHKGFRCNATMPRNGVLGKQPAGMGLWTDVVHWEAAAVPGGQPEGHPVQAGHVQHMVNLVQGTAARQSIPSSQSGNWGKPAPEPRPGPSGNQVQRIPGLWTDVKPKKKPRNRKKNGNNDAIAAPTTNRFAALNDESKDDDEEDEESDPEIVLEQEHPANSQDWNLQNKGKSSRPGVFSGKNSKPSEKTPAISNEGRKMPRRTMKKREHSVTQRSTSSLARYGVRKPYRNRDFLKKNKEADEEMNEKKRHFSNPTENEFKKKIKTVEKIAANVDIDRVVGTGTRTLAAERANGLDGVVDDDMDYGNVKNPEVIATSDVRPGVEEVGGAQGAKPDKEVVGLEGEDGVGGVGPGVEEVGGAQGAKPDKVGTGPGSEEGVGGVGKEQVEHDASLFVLASGPAVGTPAGLGHPLEDDEENEIAEMAAKLKRQLKDKNLN